MNLKYPKDFLIKILSSVIIQSDFKTVLKKFEDQGALRNEVEEYFEHFKKAKDQNKITVEQEKNIDFWGKKPFQEFKDFVDKLKETKSKSEEKKLRKMEGAELVAENDDYWVYKITNHEAVRTYGSGTKWCITQESPKWWNRYRFRNDFYFFIAKHKNKNDPLYKVAMTIDRKGKVTYFDAPDNQIKDPPTKIDYDFPPKKIEFGSEVERIAEEIKAEVESAEEDTQNPEYALDTYGDYLEVDFDNIDDDEIELINELRDVLGLSEDETEDDDLNKEILDCCDYDIDSYGGGIASTPVGEQEHSLSYDIMDDIKELSESDLEALQAMLDDMDVYIDVASFNKEYNDITYTVGSDSDYLCAELNEDKLRKRIEELRLQNKVNELEENEKNISYIERVALRSKHVDAVLTAINRITNKDILKKLLKRKNERIQRAALDRLGSLYNKNTDVQELFSKILSGKNLSLIYTSLEYANQSLLKKYALTAKDDYNGVNLAVARIKDVNFLKKQCSKPTATSDLIMACLDRDDVKEFVDLHFIKVLYENAIKNLNYDVLNELIDFIPLSEQSAFKKIVETITTNEDDYSVRNAKEKAVSKIKDQKFLYKLFWTSEDTSARMEIINRMSSAAINKLFDEILSKEDYKKLLRNFQYRIVHRSIELKNKDLMLTILKKLKENKEGVNNLLEILPANKEIVQILKSKFTEDTLKEIIHPLMWSEKNKYNYYVKQLGIKEER